MPVLKDIIHAAKHTKAVKGYLPFGIVADSLNSVSAGKGRNRYDKRDFYIHVSELIKVEKQFKFCPREHALLHFEQKEASLRRISPGFELLFNMGHSIHDHVRNRFIARSPYRDCAWGKWSCLCGSMKLVGLRPNKNYANVCKKCRTIPHIYNEFSIFNDEYMLVGNPDFILKWGNKFYIYEIKTLDRKDVNFDELQWPLGDHTLQASMYRWMFRQSGYNVDEKLRFLYVDRSTSKLYAGHPYKEFECLSDDLERLQPFLNKAMVLKKSITDKILPNRICDSHTCSRAKTCHVPVSCFSRRRNNV